MKVSKLFSIFYLLCYYPNLGESVDPSPPALPPNNNKYMIEIINDLVTVSQTFLSCNPLFGITNPGIQVIQGVSCTYNGIACALNLSAKVIEGWDMLADNNILQRTIEDILNGYSEKNAHNVVRNMTYLQVSQILNDNESKNSEDLYEDVLKDLVRRFGKVVMKPLDLKMKIYFKNNEEFTNEQIGCFSLYFGHEAAFTHRDFEIETCLSKFGAKTILKRSKERSVVRGIGAAYELIKDYGVLRYVLEPLPFLKTLNNLFINQLEEGIQKLKDMVDIIDSKDWDGRNVFFALYDNSTETNERKFMFSINARKLTTYT